MQDNIDTGRGAVGGGGDELFYLSDQFMTTSYTLPRNTNAMVAGPLRLRDAATLTVPDNVRLVVV